MTRTQLFGRALSILAAGSLAVLVGWASSPGYAGQAPATAPDVSSPFGRLTPVAPVGANAVPAAGAAAATAPRPAITTAPAAPAAGAGAAAAAGDGAPVPRVVVIDRNFIMQRSAPGRDMLAQTQNLTKAAETQFKKEEETLATEAGQLQQQMAIMAADVRAQKEKDFLAKQQSFQNRLQARQGEIQAGFAKAAQQLERALEPILQQVMRERGANMVLDRQSVIIATSDIDITPIVVQRLDRALPKVKVELTAASANAAAAATPPLTPIAP
jgi:outer membrane protein